VEPPNGSRLHGWRPLILIAIIAVAVLLTSVFYSGSLRSYIPVTVTSDRAGLVMDVGGKVMLNGVQVGRVAGISGDRNPVALRLEIDSDQRSFIPANVGARIRATTVFGAKVVELIYPNDPSPQRLAAGALLRSQNVTTEVNTVFQNLTNLLGQVDPAKLNATLAALSEGFRGQGERIGQAITDADQVLQAVNPRAETIRQDWRSLQGFADTYDAAAGDIIDLLDAATTTSTTVTRQASQLNSLLLGVIGFADAGQQLLKANQRNLIDAVNVLEPTTGLLLKYNPVITCTLQGATLWLQDAVRNIGGNGRTFVADAALLLGNDPYHYPENLPIVAAKGGPGGKPSCGSLPDVAKMFPLRQLITNTGWGTGLDIRPNPGIGNPCYADYLPVTRAVPQPPSIRQCLPGPAPGPVTAPGMPPYGAALYGPGGVPLWPGIPPAGTPPPVPVPGTPVAPGKIPANPPPPAVFGDHTPPPPDTAPADPPTP
jgi:phospholipid/cholesterol/gamma-HCH transport system substrate-binding protein